MNVEQFVMAYRVEQDLLRAILPEGFESLRPVLRINGEIRGSEEESVFLECNTPVAAFGKRGWLNIARWESPATDISYVRMGRSVTFDSSFLKITYTRVGVEGGCPAEKDNDGCFSVGKTIEFIPVERIDAPKEFCDCEFEWSFAPGNARGKSSGGKSAAAPPTAIKNVYQKQKLSAQAAAAIECEQVLGSYVVKFVR